MALDVEIIGGAELRALARRISAAGDKGLGREMGQALKRTADPVERTLREEYGELPARGGYASTFTRSVRFRTNLRTSGRTASFRLTTFSQGTHERRDIGALEAGRLRHPIYGRRRKRTAGVRAGNVLANPWAVTTVRGGYFERGTDRALAVAAAQMSDVLRTYAAKLIN